MKVTLDIEDSKATFLLELLASLNYVTIDVENQDIPEWHKQTIRERLKSSKPENYISWDDAKKKLKVQ